MAERKEKGEPWELHDLIKFNFSVAFHLPGYDKKGRKVIVQRFGVVDASKIDFVECYRVTLMLMQLQLKNPDLQTSVRGLVVIQDVAGTTLSHMSSYSPSMGKKMITIMEVYSISEGFPEGVFLGFEGFLSVFKEIMRV